MLAKKELLNPVIKKSVNDNSILQVRKTFFTHRASIPLRNLYKVILMWAFGHVIYTVNHVTKRLDGSRVVRNLV